MTPLAAAEPTHAIARRILVVDDNFDAATSLATLLAMTGYESRIAHDGVEALHAAASFRPDAVLLDIGLPTMDGFEVARRIRSEPWGRRVVLVALTGWGQDQDRQRSSAAGFDQHMVKPVDPTVLINHLSKLLSRG